MSFIEWARNKKKGIVTEEEERDNSSESKTSSTAAPDSSSTGSSFLEWNRRKRATESLEGWAKSSINLLNEMQSKSSAWSYKDEHRGYSDQISGLLSQASNWRNQYAGNEEAISYINSVVEALSDSKQRSSKIADSYSKYKSQYDYDKAMEEAEASAKRVAEITGGYDPSKHRSQGQAGWAAYREYVEDSKKKAEERRKAQEAQKEEKTFADYALEFISSMGQSPDTTLPLHIDVNQATREIENKDAQLRSPKDNWTDEQREIFGYLWNTERRKASEYAYAVNTALAAQAERDELAKIQEWSTQNIGTGILSTAGAIASAPFGLADYLYDMLEYGATGRISEGDGTVSPFEYSQAVTSGISQHLNEAGGTLREDIPIIGGKGWGDVYGLGSSILQSSAAAYTGGAGQALITFFGSGAASGVDDAIKRGATGEEAIFYGAALGTAEALAENIGLDNLLKMGSSATARQFLWNLFKQSGIEGLEEGLTAGLGEVADRLIMGDRSNFYLRYEAYRRAGLSEDDAKNKAWKEFAEDVVYDMLGGFASGAVHAGPHMGYQTYKQNQNTKATYGDSQSELVAESLEIAPDNKFAQRMQARLDKGKNLSGGQLSRLVQQNDSTLVKQDMDNIQKAIETRLAELGETGDVSALASALAKQAQNQVDYQKVRNEIVRLMANGYSYYEAFEMADQTERQELTKAEEKLIAESKYGQRVANELNTQNIRSGEYSTAWAESIGTEKVNANEYSRLLEDTQMPQEAAKADGGKVFTKNDIAPERTYEVSTDGKTLDSQGNAISIVGVESVEDGKLILKTEDGTIDSSEVQYATEAEALIYESVAKLGATPISAWHMIKAWDESSGVTAEQYAADLKQAYLYGKLNYKAGMANLNVKSATAFQKGREDAEASVKATTQASTESTLSEKNAGKRIIFEGFKYVEKNSNDVQKASMKALNMINKLTNLEIHVFKSYRKNGKLYAMINGVERIAPNGYFTDGNKVYIDINAGADGRGVMLYTMAHEGGHYIAKWNAQDFKAISDFLFEHYGEGVNFMHLLDKQKAKLRESYKRDGKPVPSESVLEREAQEELVCDMLSRMFADKNAYDTLMELKQKDLNLFQKLGQVIKKILDKIAEFIGIYDTQVTDFQFAASKETFGEEAFRQLQDLYIKAFVQADANFKTAMENVVEKNAEAVSTEEIITDGAVVTDGEGTKYSIKSMKHDIAEGKMFEDLKTYCNWTQEQVDDLRNSLNDLVEYMTPFRDILDMNETYGMEGRRFSPYKPNSDPLYKISMDFSTLCSKRLLTQYVIENLQLREDRPMSAEEQMAIRDMLNEYRKVEKGLQVACAMCYVEAARLKSPKQIQRWLDDPEPHLRNYFALKNSEFNAKVKEAQADFKESRGYDRNAPKKVMKQADVTALNKIGPQMRSQYQLSADEQAIVDKAKTLPNSTYLTAGNLANLSETDPAIYSAYTSFVRTATRSKSLETDEPYYYGDSTRDNGNGIIVSDSFIESVNRENGMRFSSWSDWRIQHMLDYITAVIDNSVRGAAMHGYTKFGEEVRVLGKTGMMFNMSGVAGTQTGLNPDGSLNFSETESIDVNEAIQLREEFPETAGLQCIGVSNEHIIALLKSDIIDYVIPYHVSGLNKALRTMVKIQGWADYTGTQNATIDKSISKEDAVDTEHWHEEPVFSEFFVGYDTGMTGIEAMRASADRYVQMCRDRGLKPKFEQFVKEENYWKLLIDRKMINQQTGNLIRQKAVTPTFDFDTIKGVVDRYVENYDSGLEARALNHIVENWDSIPQRIKDLKKKGSTKAKKASKAVDTLANETLAAQPTKMSERDTAPTFYSQMAKVVDGMKQEKFGASSVVSMLTGRGVKAEEIKWSGIEAFLEGKKSVTKAELQEFIAGSMLQIEEKVLDGKNKVEPVVKRHSLKEFGLYVDDKLIETFTKNRAGYWSPSKRRNVSLDGKEEMVRYGKKLFSNKPQWSKYILDGGNNYREILFNLPGSTYSNGAMTGHWGKDAHGILAHARVQDFDVDGKKMLFIEEIQSDWHNEGHKGGYLTKEESALDSRAASNAVRDLEREMQDYLESKNGHALVKWYTKNYDLEYEDRAYGRLLSMSEHDFNRISAIVPKNIANSEVIGKMAEYTAKRDELIDEADRIYAIVKDRAADAPFRANYHEFVLKSLLRQAAENDYDSIGWTTADIQSERWSDQYAEGYRIEYDQDIPKFLKKYGKQWGATVGSTTLNNGNEVWSMDITDAMKESVLTEGQPLYSERDTAYMDAVNRGDMKTAQKMVEEFANEALKDSALRTKKIGGKLIKMYHATPNQFTVFDKKRIGQGFGSLFGKGFYFAKDRGIAEQYDKNIGEYYLNIKNPYRYYSTDKEYIVGMLEKSGYDYDREFVDSYDTEMLESYDLIEDFLSEALGMDDVYEVFADMVQKAGFDGVWAGSDVVAFEPNQIKSADPVTYDDKGNVIPLSERFNTEKDDIRYSDRVTDQETLDFLNSQIKRGEYIVTYKSMRLDGYDEDGNPILHSPMAAEINGKFENEYELGQWYQAVEHPELIKFDKKNGLPYFELDKGVDEFGEDLGKVPARYNPYEHSSNYVINDQFKTAFKRSNLVVVEMRIPLSEITSGYQAQYAKDPVGWQEWKKGDVANALAKKGKERQVLLSRWAMPFRVLSNAEVAQQYKELLSGTGVRVPNNVVTPGLLKALEDEGVDIDYEGINRFNEQYKKKAEAREAKKNNAKKSKGAKYSDRILMGSLFSGGGTLEAGLAYQMLDKQFGVEYDGKIASVYADNHGDHIQVGKVEDFDISKYDDIFYLHASPVCHNFSKAKHGAKELAMDINSAKATAKHLETAMPQVFTVENAPGYRKSESLKIITDKLTELGYKWDVDIYNSADYGSATSRNRVILRAVKDGELPAKPEKQERTNSWDKVTRDLWETLPKSYLRPSFISAIENTRNLPILDADGKVNVNKPLLILTTTSGHTVTYCWEGDICPTLTTKCGEARLVMPDGNIYAVTPEFMGRIQGLPDDYKYPKEKTRAFTIIGNGIPTHLTKAVVGGVLDSAYEQTHDGNVLYQDRTEDSVSNRSLLANAFEGIAKPEEQQKVKEYKEKVSLIDAEEKKLRELNEQIKELSFSKGPRDTKKIRDLRDEATMTANRISTYDAQLLRLEASKPLQDVLAREKKMAYDRAKQKGDEAMAAYRLKTEAKQSEILRDYRETKAALKQQTSDTAIIEKEFIRIAKAYEKLEAKASSKSGKDAQAIADLKDALKEESKKHRDDQKMWDREFNRLVREYEYADRNISRLEDKIQKQRETARNKVESHGKTVMRNKIRSVVGELNELLLNEDKKHHVPDSLKKAVASALAFVNMDNLGVEKRVAEINRKLEELYRKKEELDRFPNREMEQDSIQADIDAQISLLDRYTKMGDKLNKLREAYDDIQNSTDPDIANAYDPVIAGALRELSQTIGDTTLVDMSIEQLSDVYDMYKMVLTRVRDANKSLIESIKENISNRASRVVGEVKRVGGEHKYRASILDPVRTFFWNNLKPVYAMENIGSETMTEAYNQVRKGEDTWAKDVNEARSYYLDKSKKYGYDSWDFDKKYTFESASGLEFELTLEQILSLYAYSKREQAHDHLRLGGFVFDSNIETHKETVEAIEEETDENGIVKKKKVKRSFLKYKVNTGDAHQITPETLADIIDTLSTDQMRFVDEMQDYLSTVMGAKGNEVTMKMYGVKLFKEKFYFPLKSAKQFMFEQNEVSGEVRIKNSGFTNKVVAKANNPVILNNFMDVWANHVNDMSMYHSFVLPLEDFNRIFNYNSPKQENVRSVSVKGTIQNAYSPAAVNYVKQLITDLNGGARSDPRETFAKSLTAKWKKAKVFSSLSVVIQQPSAIGRAFALVDPKYFHPTVDGMNHDELWAELKQYAPVAVIKEMGYFDVNMGRSTLDFIKAKEYSSFKEKAKAFFVDGDYRDEILSKAPALADELSWCAIWNAVKRETLAKNPGLDIKSEPFLMLAGARFTEVITKTQVYDSVLARSANMRSKSGLMSMVTSFMAEPTTSINMLEDALRKGKRGFKGYAGRAFASVAVSVILNNALVALVYGMRDDDEDETFAEKYMQSFVSNMMDDINPLTYLPYLKDMWSLLQGYDIERTDMSLVSDLADGLKGLVQAYSSEDGDVVGAWHDMVGAVANIGGVPLDNIRRDVNGAINFFKTIIEDVNGRATTWGSMGDALEDEVRGSLPVVGWLSGEAKADKLYDAIMSGDTAYVNRLKGSYKDKDGNFSQTKYDTALRQALRENDPRIKEAAEARFAGDFTKYKELFLEIKGDGKFSFDNIMGAINSEVNALEKKAAGADDSKKTTEDEFDAMFDVSMYYTAVVNNDQASAKIIYKELVDEKLAEGYLEHEAEDAVATGFATQVGDAYMDGEISRSKALSLLKGHTDKGESDVKKWDFELEHGFSWGERVRKYRLGVLSKSDLITAVMDIEGESRSGAEEYIRFLDLEMANENTDITANDAEGYFKYAQPAGISVNIYLDYKNRASQCVGDKDENGKTISGSKKTKVMAVINSLPISNAQKDALYYANGWAEKTINEAPWH